MEVEAARLTNLLFQITHFRGGIATFDISPSPFNRFPPANNDRVCQMQMLARLY